ncbi:MAG: hypothetical protein H7Y07_02170 [Pyrinomonadaceae bacterium]|nr:hypothetical protein [Sphingobacteriaceae bacterium]
MKKIVFLAMLILGVGGIVASFGATECSNQGSQNNGRCDEETINGKRHFTCVDRSFFEARDCVK